MSFIHDAIIELLPKSEIELEPVDATAFDSMLNTAWKEAGIVGFHMQDERLTHEQRAVLCHLANSIRGRRRV